LRNTYQLTGRGGQEKSSPSVTFGICPHAGWVYSGKTAGEVYSCLPPADTVIILATNHTGLGESSSLFPEGSWEMPLGMLEVDLDFSKQLLKYSKHVKPDAQAHLYEHAIEVQLPFIQVLNPGAKIVPVEMRDYRLDVCHEIGRAIAQTIKDSLKKNSAARFTVVASTDMTHCGAEFGQVPPGKISLQDFATNQDRLAIDQILNLNSAELEKVVKKNKITMCGFGPTAALLESAIQLGAKDARLLSYATSAEVAGKNAAAAVGYAGLLIR